MQLPSRTYPKLFIIKLLLKLFEERRPQMFKNHLQLKIEDYVLIMIPSVEKFY